MATRVFCFLMLFSARLICQPCFYSSPQFNSLYGLQVILAADFNTDGNLDLVTGNGGGVNVFLGNGTGTFGTYTTYTLAGTSRDLLARDIDNDGIKDIVVCGTSFDVKILKGLSTGSFVTMGANASGSGISVTSNDFNEDGFVDLANCFTTGNGGAITVYNSLSAGIFASAFSFADGHDPYFITSTDFNQDGHFDLATANPMTNQIRIYHGTGAGNFVFADSIPVNAPVELILADFNGDGRTDIAAGSLAKTVGVALFRRTAAGTYSLVSNFPLNGQADDLIANDFNSDGNLDLAVPLGTFNSTLNLVSVLMGNGSGSFLPAVSYSTYSSPTFMTSGDFNNDGRADLAVTHGGSDRFSLLLNCTATGINEPLTESSLSIWPNPSNGSINIQTDFNNSFDAMLVNAQGDCVWKGTAITTNSISIEGMASGLYVLKLTSKNDTVTRKIIVESTY